MSNVTCDLPAWIKALPVMHKMILLQMISVLFGLQRRAVAQAISIVKMHTKQPFTQCSLVEMPMVKCLY